MDLRKSLNKVQKELKILDKKLKDTQLLVDSEAYQAARFLCVGPLPNPKEWGLLYKRAARLYKRVGAPMHRGHTSYLKGRFYCS